MKTQELNLYIVDDNKSMVLALEQFLKRQFGEKIRITPFFDGESCLKNINSDTDVVILDYFLGEKNGNEILRSIKEINPQTEVIMLSGNESIETAVESFRLGARNFVMKNEKAWSKISILLDTLVIKPMRYLWEFRVTKFIAIFAVTFASMGAAVITALQII
jgi:DNA-binding NtrC family response regulator